MKKVRRMHQAAVLPLAVLALGVFLGACGSEQPTGNTVTTVTAPVANAKAVGMSNCTSCHVVAAEAWKLGKHANLDNGDLSGVGNPTFAHLDTQQNSEKCLSCHDALGDGRNSLVVGYTGNTPRPVVGCESCHGGGSEHSGVGPIALTATVSSGTGTTYQASEFNTCTSVCHPTYGSGKDFDFVAATHIERTMSKHAAVPGDVRKNAVSAGTPSAVYFVKKADDQACTACHDPHKNSADINKQYAESGHGDVSATPWITRNWKDPANRACQRCHTSTGYRNYNSSLSSGTTYSAALNDFIYLQQGTTTTVTGQNETLYCWACHRDYKGTLRDPGAVTTDYGYTSSTGTVYVQTSYTYPDLAGSNVCMACHTGRQNGETIQNLNAAGMPAFNFGNESFINSHYLTAGGTIFTATGYEFTGRVYDSPMLYAHSLIGTAGAPGTGSNGPCVGCHMAYTPEKHHFLPVQRAADGTITAVTSTVCSQCHIGGEAEPMSVAMLEEQKELLHDSLEVFQNQLDRRGFYFRAAHPYFFKLRSVGTATIAAGTTYDYVSTGPSVSVKSGDYFRFDADGAYVKIAAATTATFALDTVYSGQTTSGAYTVIMSGTAGGIKSWLTATAPAPFATPDVDTTGATSGKNNMGAAFNFNLIEHDPGAFAHNRFYVKRLIYDSIDWLDDNVLNFSTGATVYGLCPTTGAPAWCDGAKAYLLPNGKTGGADERP